MHKFKSGFRVIIVFMFFVFMCGCSEKYVDHGEKEMVRRESSVLDAKILTQDNENISLNLKIKDFVFSGYYQGSHIDSLDKGGGDIVLVLLGSVVGIGGCIGGGAYAFSDYPYELEIKWGGLWFAAGSCIASGAVIMYGAVKDSKPVKVIPNFVKMNAVCVDSTTPSIDKVDIIVENKNFRKRYFTDENGNIELKFDEIIPKPTEADSVLNIIVQYESMVDTVKVKRL